MNRAGDPKVRATIVIKAIVADNAEAKPNRWRPPLTGPRNRTKTQADGAPEIACPAKTNAGAAKANAAAASQAMTFADGESHERVRSSGWLTADLPGSNENL